MGGSTSEAAGDWKRAVLGLGRESDTEVGVFASAAKAAMSPGGHKIGEAEGCRCRCSAHVGVTGHEKASLGEIGGGKRKSCDA